MRVERYRASSCTSMAATGRRRNVDRQRPWTSAFRSLGRGKKMKNVANSRFTIKSWDEKPYSEGQDLPKLTRAAVTKTFSGDIAGEGHVEYLMMYRSDGSATFVGLERVVGQAAGKAGSFVLQRTGGFESGAAKESYFVIPGPVPESFEACAAKARRLLGTGLSIP